MSNNMFRICITACIAATFVAIFGLIAINSKHSNELYYKAQNECVSSGGSWVPTANGNAMCLRK